MENKTVEQDNTTHNQHSNHSKGRLLVFGAYWIRGALYITITAVLWSALRPAIRYLTNLGDGYELTAAAALSLLLAPVLFGWLGSRVINPAFANWDTVRGIKPWEDRIVDELTPGKARGFPIVLVPWPNQNFRSLAVLANKYMASDGVTEMAVVYMPGAPDPTKGGSVRVINSDQIEYTDWTVRDMFRCFVTYGATGPQMFHPGEEEETLQ